MLSFVFLVYGVVHLALWLWGWRQWWRSGRPFSLLLVLVTGTLFPYDNFRIAAGRLLGPGEALHAASVPVFAWHAIVLPVWVLAAGALAREAGLPWARLRMVKAALLATAAALSALGLAHALHLDLEIARLGDTIRYTDRSAGLRAAFGAITVNLVLLGTGAALWAQRRYPWLAAGAVVMLLAAGATGRSPWSPLVANFGELVLMATVMLASLHFARTMQPITD